MNRIFRRALTSAALIISIVLGPLAAATVFYPAVSWACDWGQVWIRAPIRVWQRHRHLLRHPSASSARDVVIGAPIPFVPMSWCIPVGPT